jgi:hypothetical protein
LLSFRWLIMGSHRKKTPSSHQRRSSGNNPINQPNGQPFHENGAAAAVTLSDKRYFEDEEEDEEDDDDFDNTARTLDFSKVLQDVEGSLVGTMASSVVAITGLLSPTPVPTSSSNSSSSIGGGSFRVTWKELVYLVLAIVVLAGLSILMGVAAGISISIHYFDAPSFSSFQRSEARQRDLGPHQRVTTLDYTIASSNFMYPSAGKASSSLTEEEENNLIALTLGRVITMSESGQRSVLLVVEEIPPLPTMLNSSCSYGTTHFNYTPHGNTSGPTRPPNNATVVHENDEAMFNGHHTPYRHRGPPDSRFHLSASKVHPTICSDGVTVGFDDWVTLKAAVAEANALSAERFMKWNEYYASLDSETPKSDPRWFDNILNARAASEHHDQEELLGYYYEEDVVFTICPGTTLKARKGPIFINAENIMILCGVSEEYSYIRAAQPTPSPTASMRSSFSREIPTCVMDVGGTHLAFGPHARNVLVRGLVFQSAKTSSLAFHYDGAQASFEDCIWIDNSGAHGSMYGAVADINSTSNVNFFRCEIGTSIASVANLGGNGGIVGGTGDNGMPYPYGGVGLAPGFVSFLSLRN